MGWLTPKRMERRRGKTGVAVIVQDISGSVWDHQGVFSGESGVLKSTFPRLRVIHFDNDARLVECEPGCRSPRQMLGTDGASDMLAGIKLAAPMDPAETFVLSDGCISRALRPQVLEIVAGMTGNIHAYYVEPFSGSLTDEETTRDGLKFMFELARAGRGRLVKITEDGNFDRRAIRRAFRECIPQGEQESTTMPDKKQQPTVYLEGGDELDFELPEDVVVDARQRVKILRGSILEEEWIGPERRAAIGGPSRQTFQIGGNDVNVRESDQPAIQKGFSRRAFGLFGRRGGGMDPDQIAGPSYEDRGQIVDADYQDVPRGHHQAALPAPNGYGAPQALPAPSGRFAPVSGPQPLAISHQPQQGSPIPMGTNSKFKSVR